MTMATDAGSVPRPDGSSVAFDVAGSGPPLVFLHGLTGDRRRWSPVTELLVDAFTCIRIDLRGHGESSMSSDYSVLTMAADVGAVLRELDAEAPAMVGNSLGGTTAALAAITHSARAVVIVDQPLRPSDLASRIRSLEDRLRGDEFPEAMIEFEEGLDLGPLSHAARNELFAAVRGMDREVVLGVWHQLFASAEHELDRAMAAALSRLPNRCLSLHGADPPPGYVAWLKANAPHVEIEIWHGMGHFLHLIDPARFADRVRHFVA